MRVLVACEFSGTVEAWSCDLLPTDRAGNHIQGDVLEVLDNGWDLMIAHPPCTYLTCTGNKWFKPEFKDRFPDRHRQRDEALEFVRRLLSAPINKIALENPVGVISSAIRKPDQIIQPYHFGSTISKKTCLWLKNLLPLAKGKIVDPDLVMVGGKPHSRMHIETGRMPAEQRWKIRSITPAGIANAMALQWGAA
jgi:hypothetical protein